MADENTNTEASGGVSANQGDQNVLASSGNDTQPEPEKPEQEPEA